MKRLALLTLLALAVPAARSAAVVQEAPLVVDDERVKAPKRVKLVRPEYPPEARAQGIRGIVILALTIDAEGKVAAVEVIRSIPGLDEAAIGAARQWEYEPPRVDGKPASVKVTVPITFALELPALTRQSGIPELRSGAAPVYPRGAEGQKGAAAADLTLDREGRVAQAEILSGESPWIDALLQAVRTWVFVPESGPATVSFRVEATFESGGRGATPRVALNLTGLRHSESLPVEGGAAPEPPPPSLGAAPPAQPEPPPAAAGAAPHAPEAKPAAETATHPPPAEAAPPPAAPAVQSAPAVPAGAAPAATDRPAPEGSPAAPAPKPAPSPEPGTPEGGMPEPSPKTKAPTGGVRAPPGVAGPSIKTPQSEVLTGAPAAPPTAAPAAQPLGPGTSAVRNVTLEDGIPDLSAGRRPVVPPLARLQAADGIVTVRFSIDGAGDTQVQAVDGPEILQRAARDTVSSWRFQRTSRDRVYAIAEVLYRGDAASARVHRAE